MHHILVVDDEADICEVVKTGFEAGGKYRVDCATNQLAAFAALRRRPLDLALLDMLMRENAGGEIEAFAGEMRVPVLRMTGHPEIMRKSLAQGLPVLMKPFRVGDLVDIVDHLLVEAHRLRRGLEDNVSVAPQLTDKARANVEARQLAWDQFADRWRRICGQRLGGG